MNHNESVIHCCQQLNKNKLRNETKAVNNGAMEHHHQAKLIHQNPMNGQDAWLPCNPEIQNYDAI